MTSRKPGLLLAAVLAFAMIAAIAGVKESIRESLPGTKQRSDDDDSAIKEQ